MELDSNYKSTPTFRFVNKYQNLDVWVTLIAVSMLAIIRVSYYLIDSNQADHIPINIWDGLILIMPAICYLLLKVDREKLNQTVHIGVSLTFILMVTMVTFIDGIVAEYLFTLNILFYTYNYIKKPIVRNIFFVICVGLLAVLSFYELIYIGFDKLNFGVDSRQAMRLIFMWYFIALTIAQLYHTIYKEKATQERSHGILANYKNMFDNNLLGIALVDHESNFQQANQSFCDLMGYSLEELSELSMPKLTAPSSVKKSEELIKMLHKGEIHSFIQEKEYSRKNGDIVHALVSVQGIFKENHLQQSIVSVQDISQRKEIEKTLSQSEIKYKEIFDNTLGGLAIIEDGIIKETNQAFSNVFELSKSEIIGKSILEFLHPEDIENTQSEINNLGEGQKSTIRTYNRFLINGDTKHVLLNIIARYSEDDQFIGSLLNIYDITALIEATEESKSKNKIIVKQLKELNTKNSELEKYIESNLQLENFAYIASHDLKAPLRTISSFSYLLKKSSYDLLEHKDKKYLDIIINSSEKMQVLISDLLQYARINTEKVNIKRINLKNILHTNLQLIIEDIKESKAEIKLNSIPDYINADQTKIDQLFHNLIRNAIKFSKLETKPVVTVNCEEQKEEWVFSVHDNGIGIKKENQDKIFGLFNKLHSNDEFEGTGLGLTICKKIVAKHKGKIWVESIYGKGSTFYFTIAKNLKQDVDLKHMPSDLVSSSN